MARGKVKIPCDTTTCRYCKTDNKDKKYCDFKPYIKNQKCANFTPNMIYYVIQFFDAMRDSNMLLPQNINKEVQIGIYYAMKIYRLSMVQRGHGDWRWFQFYLTSEEGNENKEFLNTDEIVNLPVDEEAFLFLSNKLMCGELPPFEDEREKMEKERAEEEAKLKPFEVDEDKLQWYGFIDTLGNWYPADFGNHEQLAFDILTEKGWENEYWERKKKQDGLAVDFLVVSKGWVLIHNPWGSGDVIVSTSPNHTLTKAQKEFLYVYFMQHKNPLKAETYMTNGSI